MHEAEGRQLFRTLPNLCHVRLDALLIFSHTLGRQVGKSLGRPVRADEAQRLFDLLRAAFVRPHGNAGLNFVGVDDLHLDRVALRRLRGQLFEHLTARLLVGQAAQEQLCARRACVFERNIQLPPRLQRVKLGLNADVIRDFVINTLLVSQYVRTDGKNIVGPIRHVVKLPDAQFFAGGKGIEKRLFCRGIFVKDRLRVQRRLQIFFKLGDTARR